jgi:ubiquinone biosynthesis protein UbiJ
MSDLLKEIKDSVILFIENKSKLISDDVKEIKVKFEEVKDLPKTVESLTARVAELEAIIRGLTTIGKEPVAEESSGA